MAARQLHLRHPRLVVAALAVFLAVVVGGVSFYLQRSDGSKAAPGPTVRYVEGVAGTYQRINPLFATNDVDADLVQLVFSGLLKLGPRSELQPDLAADLPDVSADGLRYTFRLRPGARWQDDEPVTSADVVFTIGRLKDPGFQGDPTLAEPWANVDVSAPDAETVVFTLKQPSAPFLARYGTIGILPAHLLGTLSGSALYDAPFNTAPVGSGPYRLQALTAQEAVLVANRDYYGGEPNIPTVVLRFYADVSAATQAMASGELDGLFLQNPGAAAPEELAGLKSSRQTAFGRDAYLALYLNNDQVAFFQDARVRRALSLAVDRKAIVDAGLGGFATVSASPIPPGTWAYDGAQDHPGRDLDQARKLLSDAGWVVNPTTGVLTRAGAEFRFTIRTDNDPARSAIATLIAKQLGDVGIRASVVTTTVAVLQRDFLQPRRYDAALIGWDQGPDPDPYFGWHSSQMGSAGLNLANYADIVADQLIAKARQTNDGEVRKDLYSQFQGRWDEVQPSLVLAYPQYLYIQKDDVKGVKAAVLATPAQRFAEIAGWSK